MLKLREMQLKQQQAKAAAEANAAAANAGAAAPAAGTTNAADGTLLMHRGNSKESLVEIRKQKSRDNVFTLKTKQSGESASKRANAAELRAQKGTCLINMLRCSACAIDVHNINDILLFRHC